MGQVDFGNVVEEMRKDETDERGKYKQYTERDRLATARYAKQNGPRRTACKFDKKCPNLNKSTERSFLKKYTAMKNVERKTQHPQSSVSQQKRRGKPLTLGMVYKKILDFLIALRHKGGVVNSTIAIGAAKGLIQSRSDPDLKQSKSIPHELKTFSSEWDLLEGWQQRLKYQ